jgi:hypothetical protein
LKYSSGSQENVNGHIVIWLTTCSYFETHEVLLWRGIIEIAQRVAQRVSANRQETAYVAAKTANRGTALLHAAQNSHKQVVRLLLEKGANVKAEDFQQQTALHLVAANGHKLELSTIYDSFVSYRNRRRLYDYDIA